MGSPSFFGSAAVAGKESVSGGGQRLDGSSLPAELEVTGCSFDGDRDGKALKGVVISGSAGYVLRTVCSPV
jgi:hypothetical protein